MNTFVMVNEDGPGLIASWGVGEQQLLGGAKAVGGSLESAVLKGYVSSCVLSPAGENSSH